jgi:leader peptidase (prepilin peptidase)/N-methyltransferase
MHLVQLVAVPLFGLPLGALAVAVVRPHAPGMSRAAMIFIGTAAILSTATAIFAVHDPFFAAATALLGWSLIVLAAIDIAVLRLPDALTLPLTAAGLAVTWRLPDQPLLSHAATAALAYLALWGLGALFRRLRDRDALGLGDAKLAAAAGAWLGPSALPATIVLASAAALAWIAIRATLMGPDEWRNPLPFGPPLALAFWTVWLTGWFSSP